MIEDFNYSIRAGLLVNNMYLQTNHRKYYSPALLKNYINSFNSSIWYVIVNKAGEEIIRHNYYCRGTVYLKGAHIPRALLEIIGG